MLNIFVEDHAVQVERRFGNRNVGAFRIEDAFAGNVMIWQSFVYVAVCNM